MPASIMWENWDRDVKAQKGFIQGVGFRIQGVGLGVKGVKGKGLYGRSSFFGPPLDTISIKSRSILETWI